MPSIGITGGIATGKTIFARALGQLLSAEIFDADECARSLLEHDTAVLSNIRVEFGDGVFNPDGAVDRGKIREIVFGNTQKRRVLESILHPRIREQWIRLVEARNPCWQIMDIPLLFETQAETYFDFIVVVAASPAARLERLEKNRHLGKEISEKIMASQLDLQVKIQKASYVVWNNGLKERLQDQAVLLATHLNQGHGGY